MMKTNADFPLFTVLDLKPSPEHNGVIHHVVKVGENDWLHVVHNPSAEVGNEILMVNPEFNTYEYFSALGFGNYDAIEEAEAVVFNLEMEELFKG